MALLGPCHVVYYIGHCIIKILFFTVSCRFGFISFFNFLFVLLRVLELKNEMVLLEYSEYHYLDDVLSDLKLTPVSLKSINLSSTSLI